MSDDTILRAMADIAERLTGERPLARGWKKGDDNRPLEPVLVWPGIRGDLSEDIGGPAHTEIASEAGPQPEDKAGDLNKPAADLPQAVERARRGLTGRPRPENVEAVGRRIRPLREMLAIRITLSRFLAAELPDEIPPNYRQAVRNMLRDDDAAEILYRDSLEIFGSRGVKFTVENPTGGARIAFTQEGGMVLGKALEFLWDHRAELFEAALVLARLLGYL